MPTTLAILLIGLLRAAASGRSYITTAAALDRSADMTGVTLRIVVVEDYPFVQVREDPLNMSSPILPPSEWSGWIIALLSELSLKAGFDYELQLPSGPNTLSYGAGTKDVQNGLCRRNNDCKKGPGMAHNLTSVFVNGAEYAGQILNGKLGHDRPPDDWRGWNPDVMMSAAYITPQRSSFSTMTTPFTRQPLAVLVGAPPKHWARQFFLAQWLKPFSGGLWRVILSSVVFSGIIFVMIEGDHPGSEDFEGRAYKSGHALFKATEHTIYIAVLTFTGQRSYRPNTIFGKTFALTYQFYCLVVVATYTAKLAAHLAAAKIDHQPQSFGSFFTPDPYDGSYKRACVLANSAYANFLKKSDKYGVMEPHMVEVDSIDGMCEQLEIGNCDGIIHVRMKLDYIEYGGLEKFTGLKVVDELPDGPQHMAALVRDWQPRAELVQQDVERKVSGAAPSVVISPDPYIR
jgi:hypothetical protein